MHAGILVMSSSISRHLREAIATRADFLCEYCLIHEDDTFFGCEVDHIISLKHGGITKRDNLAFVCFFCNRRKGTDLGSLVRPDEFILFFNPRKDQWRDHFHLEGAIIKPLTDVGIVTARIFGFNSNERVLEREVLIAENRYPMPPALKRMALDE